MPLSAGALLGLEAAKQLVLAARPNVSGVSLDDRIRTPSMSIACNDDRRRLRRYRHSSASVSAIAGRFVLTGAGHPDFWENCRRFEWIIPARNVETVRSVPGPQGGAETPPPDGRALRQNAKRFRSNNRSV
jgi:hypothetical protein